MVCEEIHSMVSGTVVAVAVSIGSSVLDNFGVTLQKDAHRHVREKEYYFLNKKWILGLALYLIAQICNAVALAFAPLAIFACLAGIGLVVNSFFSTFYHHETLSRQSILGMVLITIGTIFIAIFGPSASTSMFCTIISVLTLTDSSWNHLMRLAGDEIFIAYFITLVLFASLWFTAIIVAERRVHQTNYVETDVLINNLSSVSVPNPEQVADGLAFRFLGVGYAVFGGMIGSITALVAKGFLEMMKDSFSNDNQFLSPAPYLCLLLVLLLGGTQIHFLNMGLRRFDQLLTVPVFIVSITIFSSAVGIIFFQEYVQFTVLELVFFSVSMSLTWFGIALIAWGQFNIRSSHKYSSISSDPHVPILS